MASNLLHLDVGLTGPTLDSGLPATSGLARMQGVLVPETGGFEAVSRLPGKLWWVKRQASTAEEGMPPEELQDLIWVKVFSDPTHWWDNRWTSRHVVEWQLAMWGAGMKRPASTSAEGQRAFAALEDHWEVETCSKSCEDGRGTDCVDALNLVVQTGCHIDDDLLYRILKRCIANKDLVVGRRIHALTIKSGYEGHSFLATPLIGLYASHGRLEEAMQVFFRVPTPDVYVWAAIIFACARHGEAAQAIRLYQQMCESTIKPDNRIYVAVLKACAIARDLVAGKEVHAHILGSVGKPDIFVQTGLLAMYAKCGSLDDAQRVFDRLPDKDVVTWTAMIAGYAKQGMGQEALHLYRSMQQEGLSPPDSVTFVCLLQACASVGISAMHEGKQLHATIEERGLQGDLVLGCSLVNMYAKCGSLEDARRVFFRLPQRDVVTWNSMIAAYAQQGMGWEALSLYRTMQHEGPSLPNSVTFVCLLQACVSVGVAALHEGKQLHAHIEERGLEDDVVLGCSLVNMYAKCGSLEHARRVFDRLPDRNVVTWTAMIAGYAQQGMGQEALSLYGCMQQEGLSPPDPVTYVCLLQACASVGVTALHDGIQLHAQIRERGLQGRVDLGCSLVNMYAKCGSLDDARRVFDKLQDRDVMTWNAMLAGYAQHGMGEEALDLYSSMQQEGLSSPDFVTFTCLLQACAMVAGLPLGKQLHAEIKERGFQGHAIVGAALVNMYAKCASMFDSQEVFDSLPERTIDAWNALIGGYTRQGDSRLVFESLDRMKVEGTQPNGITFVSVLTVCSHVGLVDKGQMYFDAMRTDYGISPSADHYTCMVDLLGRAGHLDEALHMAKTMPAPPNSTLWHTLLGACSKWNNVEIGQQAFDLAVRLDEKDAPSYVLMSNIYARAQLWERAKEIQARRKKSGAWKEPGQCWWTDMDGVVHTFVVGNKQHSESDTIQLPFLHPVRPSKTSQGAAQLRL